MQTRNQTSVEAVVREFVEANYLFRAGAASLAEDDSFLGQGIIDSMGILELVQFLEERFGLQVADDEVVPDNLDSIARVSAYVRRKLAANGAGVSHAG